MYKVIKCKKCRNNYTFKQYTKHGGTHTYWIKCTCNYCTNVRVPGLLYLYGKASDFEDI